MVNNLKERIKQGYQASTEDIRILMCKVPDEELFIAAEEITACCTSCHFDMCSIINAKSGLCSEDCKWCAQSARHKTGVKIYGLVSKEECIHAAKIHAAQGVARFSLVTSGRRPSDVEIDELCERVKAIRKVCDMEVCASLGLLTEGQLKSLLKAGVSRYHCNLETAPSYFSQLCTTHTQEQKLETLRAAQRIGMQICCGGIIGMGETEIQRVELAFALRDLQVKSIPINILQPIKGTPLQDMSPLSEREILRTVALFRFIHPEAYLRFAGGRAGLSDNTLRRAMKIGVNAAIVGDMLTTLGSNVEEDKKRIKETGYEI